MLFSFDKINWSIKRITLLGFALVVLPLALTMLFSAHQVNTLSKQGTEAIFNVAEILDNSRALSRSLARTERFAKQFIILQSPDIYEQYQIQYQALMHRLTSHYAALNDQEFILIAAQMVELLTQIDHQLKELSHSSTALEGIQKLFSQITLLNQQLSEKTDKLIDLQAANVNRSAENIEKTLLHSLVVIPIVLLLAAFFTVLIARPLKQLTRQIDQLKQGQFTHKIRAQGSLEVKDIANALELMRARLQALELQKSSFIRHISHELKTPLAAIREGTELLYDHSVGQLNKDQQEITEIIRESVSRLQQLIEDLLDFNIVLDSTSLQDKELVDIKDEIEQAMTLRKLDIKRKNIDIDTNIVPISLQCNRKQLSVILDNLLSNAIKFSPTNGIINIDVSQTPQHLKISIQDHGPGIGASHREKVFDAFYQAHNTEKGHIKSSGLGLTIVKELLLRLNGEIELISETVAPSFTRFNVYLPLLEVKEIATSSNEQDREIA